MVFVRSQHLSEVRLYKYIYVCTVYSTYDSVRYTLTHDFIVKLNIIAYLSIEAKQNMLKRFRLFKNKKMAVQMFGTLNR